MCYLSSHVLPVDAHVSYKPIYSASVLACTSDMRLSDQECHVAGPKLGKWIILPPQLIVMIGLGITYTVTGGSSLHNFYGIVCSKNAMGECHSAGLSVWIIVFSALHLFLIQVSMVLLWTVQPHACHC